MSNEARIIDRRSTGIDVVVECPYCDHRQDTHARMYDIFRTDDMYRTITCDECDSYFDVPPVKIMLDNAVVV